MNKRTRKNPAQMIRLMEEKLRTMKENQAFKEARNHPLAQPVVARLNDILKQEREYKKGLGKGPQSFDARINSHELWIKEILALKAEAKCYIRFLSDIKTSLNETLDDLAEEIAAGEEPTEASVEKRLAASFIIPSPELEDLRTAIVEARRHRTLFKERGMTE